LTSESGGRATHTVIELSFIILNQTLRSLHAIVFPADSIPCSSLINSLSLAVYPQEFGNAPVDYKMPAMVAILTACHVSDYQLRFGVYPKDLFLTWRALRVSQHTPKGRELGHSIARGRATLLIGRLRDFVVAPFLWVKLLFSARFSGRGRACLWTATTTSILLSG